MKKLYLLDAFALIFRAYFAFQKNPLINSKGFNVSAIAGFLNTLQELITKYNPTHIAVCFDAIAQTDRQAEHDFYKANRAETPEDIILSVPYIKAIIEGFNIQIVEIDGYEADDLIGTLAHKAGSKDVQVHIVSMDKDLAQMVTENIFVHKPPYMGKPAEILGLEEIKEKWEIDYPKQIIDILGLWGDAVDNIPGVKGIGEKTAKQLVKQYGTVEGIYGNLDKLKDRQKAMFEEHREMAFISKKLATIHIDAPVEWNEETFILKEINKPKLAEIFAELEFRTQAKRILGDNYSITNEVAKIQKTKTDINQISMFDVVENTENITTETSNIAIGNNINNVEHKYILVDNETKINELINELNNTNYYCFDTETTGVDANNCEIVGMSFSIKNHEAYYIPISENREEALKIIHQFKNIFEDETKTIIGQNLKYDMLVLKWYNIEIKNKHWDTMIAHYLMDADTKHNMNILAENYLNYTPISITELIGKKGVNQGTMRDVAIEKIVDYAAEDADITLQLYHKFETEINNTYLNKIFYDVEIPLIEVLADMEFEGINLDVDFLNDYSKELNTEILILQEAIFEAAEVQFNLESPKQMGEVLFEKLKIPYTDKKTKTGQYSTGEDTLQKLKNEHPIIEKIMDYRELTKLQSTYVSTLPTLINPKTKRIHTNYNQALVATGRLSSNNPNLQNIPIRTNRGKKIRKAFIPRDENYILLSADYSQIELRIVASISKDENMIAAFNSGLDIHTATAANVFGVSIEDVTPELRRQAKSVNFGIIYGMSAFGLSQQLGISKTDAGNLITQYFEKYSGIKKYMTDAVEFAKQHNYAETLLGRRRNLRDINAGNWNIRGFAERNAINAPIQGTAADMIKLAMINIHKELKKNNLQSKMILQVHDELIFDVLKTEQQQIEKIVLKEMQNALPLLVPIEVSVGFGNNWLEAH